MITILILSLILNCYLSYRIIKVTLQRNKAKQDLINIKYQKDLETMERAPYNIIFGKERSTIQ